MEGEAFGKWGGWVFDESLKKLTTTPLIQERGFLFDNVCKVSALN
jgi:hypothetical protein